MKRIAIAALLGAIHGTGIGFIFSYLDDWFLAVLVSSLAICGAILLGMTAKR
jgi:hypothetical protein